MGIFLRNYLLGHRFKGEIKNVVNYSHRVKYKVVQI